MAGWISSKLKVAEDFLHQIDQQAAGTLRKNEKARSDEELGLETSTRPTENKPLLKDQLKKKSVDNFDLIGKIRSDHSSNLTNTSNSLSNSNSFNNREKESEVSALNSNPKSSAITLTDSDWTELLSAPPPSKKIAVPGGRTGNGMSRVGVARKDGTRKGSFGNAVALDGKRNQKGQTRVLKSERKSEVESENKVNSLEGRVSDAGDVTSSTSSSSVRTSASSVELRNDEESVERRNLDWKDLNVNLVSESKIDGIKGRTDAADGLANEDVLHSKDNRMDKYRPSAKGLTNYDKKQELKIGLNDAERSSIATGAVDGCGASSQIADSIRRSPSSPSDESADSETDSGSSSGSESEREREERRKRRQQILAKKAAAKAIDAIKERENNVARLEGEKQSLEKIIEEQAKQQVLEASKLQTTMMETMQAVEQEKQKHNNTRMEALACVAKLETTNADLARSLASAQKNLEVKINWVSDLRQQIDLKEAAHEELKRKISSIHQGSNKLEASKGVEIEREILEDEYSLLTDKIEQLQEKAKTLETSIESTKRELQNPTEMEIELKRRLSQLTDHLIQKQAQVEALSSGKAMLQFKIEAVSRLLAEKKSEMDSADFASTTSRGDLESGVWELPNSKLKPMLKERIRSGKQHLGSFVRQLDSIFCAGAVFLRRNSTARMWSLIYFVCLHVWVIYILMSHSPVSDEAKSGAVVSLENINNTGAV